MWAWPELELTDYERKFVSYYKHFDNKTKTMKPGVLKRVYQCVLNDTAVTTSADFATVHTSGQLQIARRSRIHKLMFMGDLSAWKINIHTATGEQYTNGMTMVSAMVPGALYNAAANIGNPVVTASGLGNYPFAIGGVAIDPNWELLPNQTLVFDGELISGQSTRFLKIGIHVWEFPGMELSAGGV